MKALRLALATLLGVALSVGTLSTPATAQDPFSVSWAGPTTPIAVDEIGCHDIPFTATITGINSTTMWSIDPDGSMIGFTYGYGPGVFPVEVMDCYGGAFTRQVTVTATVTIYGPDAAVGSGRGPFKSSISGTVQYIEPTSVSIDYIDTRGASGRIGPAPYSAGQHALLMYQPFSKSSWQIVANVWTDGNGEWSIAQKLAPGRYEVRFSGAPNLSAESSATKNLKKIVIKVRLVKTTDSYFSGTAKPGRAAKGTKITIFHKPIDDFEYSKYGTAKVRADGSWTLRKTVKPGAYYAKAGTDTTTSTRTPVTKFKIPAVDDTPVSGATAICRDGTYSYSQNRSGTCSWHGGVLAWL